MGWSFGELSSEGRGSGSFFLWGCLLGLEIVCWAWFGGARMASWNLAWQVAMSMHKRTLYDVSNSHWQSLL